MTSSQENSPGAEVTAHSPYRNRIWTKLRDTSQIKRNIIAYAPSRRNSKSLPIATDCSGRIRKAVKTALCFHDADNTGLKPGVNEKRCAILCLRIGAIAR